jgi:hypothetical protein
MLGMPHTLIIVSLCTMLAVTIVFQQCQALSSIFGIDDKISFAVQWQNVTSEDTLDPLHHYPHFPAQVYLDTTSNDLEMVNPSWIVSHYVQWSFKLGYVVVLALFRVSPHHP